jgi:hypothetical protein
MQIGYGLSGIVRPWQTSQFGPSRYVTLPCNTANREGNYSVAPTFSLIPAGTRLESSGNGSSVDVSSSQTRTFLCCLTVTEQIEQESLDVSIWGSADSQDFGKRPLLKIPQQFYSGTTKMVLDISARAEVKFLRAKWELNRWGRVAPTPMFVAELDLAEVQPMSRNNAAQRDVLVQS